MISQLSDSLNIRYFFVYNKQIDHYFIKAQTKHMLIIDSRKVSTNSVITVAPLLGFYSQYNLIRQQKSVGSFSIDICGILIIANILRIYFWFSSGYAINLFIQSFVVIGMQFVLLDICIKVGYKKIEDKDTIGIWRWNKLDHFIIFSIIFAIIMGVLTVVLQMFKITSYGPVLGFVSLTIQATLGLPQLLRNHQAKSVAGLSIPMIGIWFIGDFMKTLYFIIKIQPFQFILSGAFQLAIDTMILIQVMAYSLNDQQKPKYKNINPKEGQRYNDIQFGENIRNVKN